MGDEDSLRDRFKELHQQIHREYAQLEKDAASSEDVNLDKLTSSLRKLQEFAVTPRLSLIISNKSAEFLAIFLQIYRYCPPSLASESFSTKTSACLKQTVKKCCAGLISACMRNRQFAHACLRKVIENPEEAFPLWRVLRYAVCFTIKAGATKASFWYATSEDGQLLIFKQIFACVASMLPELMHPVKTECKEKEDVLNLYDDILISLCVLAMSCGAAEMEGCRLVLAALYHQSSHPLVVQLASDFATFIGRVAPPQWTLFMTFDVIRAMMVSLSQKSDTTLQLAVTCTRLTRELNLDGKMDLLEYLPVQTHFIAWSFLDLTSFVECGGLVTQLYQKSMNNLKKVAARKDKPRMGVEYHAQFAWLPYALQCLTNIGLLTPEERASAGGLEKFTSEVTKVFMALWYLLTLIPIGQDVLGECFCRLLKLGSVLITGFSDQQISTILEFLQNADWTCVETFAFAAEFVAAVGERKKLTPGILASLQTSLKKWANIDDREIQLKTLDTFIVLRSKIRCKKFVAGCLGPDSQLPAIAKLFAESTSAVSLETWGKVAANTPRPKSPASPLVVDKKKPDLRLEESMEY